MQKTRFYSINILWFEIRNNKSAIKLYKIKDIILKNYLLKDFYCFLVDYINCHI